MSYWFTIASLTGINVILAYSAYISYMSDQVSIGQAAYFGIGAYTAASLTVLFNFDLFSAVVIGGFAGGLLSLICGIPTLRLKGYHFTIATVAFAEAVRVILHNTRYGRPREEGGEGNRWLGPDGPVGFRHINYLNDNNISTAEYALIIWFCVLIVVLLFVIIERSRISRLLRTIAEDEVVARAIGISTSRLKVAAFVFGGVLAGVSGGLYAHLLTFISGSDFTIQLSVIVLAFVIIGGGQTLWGPLLGAIIFTLLPELLRPIQGFRLEIFGLAILLTMLFRPSGAISAQTVRTLKAKFRRADRPPPGVGEISAKKR